MSTKIYDGCRMPRSVDLGEFATLVRTTLTPLRYTLEATEIAKMIAHLVDERAAGLTVPDEKNPKDWIPFMVVCRKWKEEQAQHGEYSTFNDPFRFSIQIITHGDYHYLLPYFDDDAYREVLFNLPDVEHYPYWNNTEEPEGVTRKQWKAREQEWDEVPGVGYDVPAMHGLTLELGIPNEPMYNLRERLDLVLGNQPSLKSREYHLLEQVVSKLRPWSSQEDRGMMGYFNYIIRSTRGLLGHDLVNGLEPLTKDVLLGKNTPAPIRIDEVKATELLDALDATGELDD